VEDLIEYIRLMGDKLKDNPHFDAIMVEITNVASDNWVQNGIPNLSKEQLNKVFLKVTSTLN